MSGGVKGKKVAKTVSKAGGKPRAETLFERAVAALGVSVVKRVEVVG